VSSRVDLVSRQPRTDEITQAFAQRLRELRRERGFTQKDLGERVGVARSMIVNYEGGFHHPPLPTLIKLARELGVRVDFLVGDEATGLDEIQDRELFEFFSKVDKLDFRIRNALKEIILGLVEREESPRKKTRAA